MYRYIYRQVNAMFRCIILIFYRHVFWDTDRCWSCYRYNTDSTKYHIDINTDIYTGRFVNLPVDMSVLMSI